MISLFLCITRDHNLWLLLPAGLICAVGSWVTISLYRQARTDAAWSGLAWVFLGAVAAGSTIWCTHFVAMLAFDPGVPVAYEPGLTALSLVIAILACAGGLSIGRLASRGTPELGGAVFGAGIAAMHYTGMAAFAAEAMVTWRTSYALASLLAGVAFGAGAFGVAARLSSRRATFGAAILLVLAILSLHFTAMAAMEIIPLAPHADSLTTHAARGVLAVAVAGVGLLVLGTGVASYVVDERTRRQAAARLRHLAHNDTLTGLPNRNSFFDRLGRTIASCSGEDKIALLAIDLDRFKEVNDIHGHAAGDQVLRVLSARMVSVLRDGEVIARLGGDEFVAMTAVRSREEALDLATRLEKQLFSPVMIENTDHSCGASIGIALFPDDAASLTVLMNNADLAMHRAKSSPSQSVCFYEGAMDELVRARRKITNELREAPTRGQFELRYQAQASVATGEITGYEVLLRWRHPERGYVPPSEFIPLAEENGLILPIGEWVLRTACTEAAKWETPHKIAVNLSGVQLGQIELPRLVHEILIETKLPPSRLELEITETSLMRDPDRTTHILRQLKALGVSIAMDDFGTGYSSLSTLRAFPFDKIKLDRSFILEIEGSDEARSIIRAVLALGQSLRVPVLAEGVETANQLEFLREHGCDEAQGYLLGYPDSNVACERHIDRALLSSAGVDQREQEPERTGVSQAA